jgi:NAD+ kinase
MINNQDLRHVPPVISFKKIGIIGKPHKILPLAGLKQLLSILKDFSIEVLIEEQTAKTHKSLGIEFLENYESFSLTALNHSNDLDPKNKIDSPITSHKASSTYDKKLDIDAAIVIGGDGTMLGAARALCRLNMPLIGINSGRVGFVTDIYLQDIALHLPNMLQGEYLIDRRHLLAAKVRRDLELVYEGLAVNDVVLARTSNASMIEVSVFIDGAYMCHQRADGLIISTPTGSTAYSLSVGGSIMHPKVAALLLAPIAPQGLSHRPIAIPIDSQIEIRIETPQPTLLNCDMQTFNEIRPQDRIEIARADQDLIFLHPTNYDYYQMLRQKLHWHER